MIGQAELDSLVQSVMDEVFTIDIIAADYSIGQITQSEIAAATITATQIAAATITAGKLMGIEEVWGPPTLEQALEAWSKRVT